MSVGVNVNSLSGFIMSTILFKKEKTRYIICTIITAKDYAEHLRVDYDYETFHVNGEAAWFHAPIPWTARWRVVFENAVVIHDGLTMTAYSFDAPAAFVQKNTYSNTPSKPDRRIT